MFLSRCRCWRASEAPKNPPLPLYVDVVGPVHHHLGHRRLLHQELDGAEADELIGDFAHHKTWKGAGALAGFIVGVIFAFSPLQQAVAMGLILPPVTIGLIRLSDRVGLRLSGPFARRCSSCSASVGIRASYSPLCGWDLKGQA